MDCDPSNCTLEVVYINASTLHSSHSFLLPISLLSAKHPILLSTLVDSGSSHCFLNASIVHTNSLQMTPVIPLIALKLIDGMTNHLITKKLKVLVVFPD